MESFSTPLTEVPVQEGEFAAGEENALNRAFFRFVNWLFRGPHLTAESIWVFAALTMTEISVLLFRQLRGFWIDPTISRKVTFFGAPLSWGAWPILALYVGYIFLISMLLRAINLKLAFPLWTILCFLHTQNFSDNFACWSSPSFNFVKVGNCSYWYAASFLFVGIFWAFAVVHLAQSRAIPLMRELQDDELISRPGVLRLGSIIWVALLLVGILITALQPQPEWKKIEGGETASERPSAREHPALAYSSTQQIAILFGGTSTWSDEIGWIPLGDTWQWDGENWEQLNPETNPPARHNSCMAYDLERDVFVMFSGYGESETTEPVFLGDVWEWDGDNWVEKTPKNNPPARSYASLYFDPSRKKIILYTGYHKENEEVVFHDDFWEWDGQTWTQVYLEHSTKTFRSAILYFEQEQAPIMMDGGGLWTLHGAYWYQPNFPTSPSGRWSSSLAYDPLHQQVVMFGGYIGKDFDLLDETWVYNGSSWEKLITKNQPSARSSSNMFFDSYRNRVVLYGGYDEDGANNDQWELVLP
jgi:hypothetical protein